MPDQQASPTSSSSPSPAPDEVTPNSIVEQMDSSEFGMPDTPPEFLP